MLHFLPQYSLEANFLCHILIMHLKRRFDSKFIESSFHYIISSDQDKDGLDLEEFIDGIVPKETEHKKREPEYYPEQEL